MKENVLTNRSEYGNEKNKIKMYLDGISFKLKSLNTTLVPVVLCLKTITQIMTYNKNMYM